MKGDRAIAESFSRVKEDMGSLSHFLASKNDEFDIRMRLLEHKLQKLTHVKVDELAKYITQLVKFMHSEQENRLRFQKQVGTLAMDIRQCEQKLQDLDCIKDINQRLEVLEKSKHSQVPRPLLAQKNTLTSHVTKQVMKNSKGYLQQIILNAIVKQHSLHGKTLKNTIVDDQKITSKASLYRILSELEKLGKITVTREGKEKIYSTEFIEARQ